MTIAAFNSSTILAVLPEILLLALAVLVLGLDMLPWSGRHRILGWVTAAGMALILTAAFLYSRPGESQDLIFGGMLRHDWPAFTFMVLAVFAGAFYGLGTSLFVAAYEVGSGALAWSLTGPVSSIQGSGTGNSIAANPVRDELSRLARYQITR